MELDRCVLFHYHINSGVHASLKEKLLPQNDDDNHCLLKQLKLLLLYSDYMEKNIYDT